jgi:ADP-ribosylglycohydrolase
MERLKRGVTAVEAGPTGEGDNGNGSLMRILPAALYLATADVQDLASGIWDISRITHGHPRACSACYIYALLVRELLAGVSPEEAYRSLCSLPEDRRELQPSLSSLSVLKINNLLSFQS